MFEQDAAKLLGSLHRLGERADASERKILDAAIERDKVVRAEMERLRPLVMTERGAARAYQKAALELRRLSIVISMAKKHIGTG